MEQSTILWQGTTASDMEALTHPNHFVLDLRCPGVGRESDEQGEQDKSLSALCVSSCAAAFTLIWRCSTITHTFTPSSTCKTRSRPLTAAMIQLTPSVFKNVVFYLPNYPDFLKRHSPKIFLKIILNGFTFQIVIFVKYCLHLSNTPSLNLTAKHVLITSCSSASNSKLLLLVKIYQQDTNTGWDMSGSLSWLRQFLPSSTQSLFCLLIYSKWGPSLT